MQMGLQIHVRRRSEAQYMEDPGSGFMHFNVGQVRVKSSNSGKASVQIRVE